MSSVNNHLSGAVKQAFFVGLGAFFLAIALSFFSQSLLVNITTTLPAFALLIIIILAGIFFDIIGTAATKASEKPLHAKAARRIPGAKTAIKLVKNAAQVANFCNDVVGDISGTLSGAIGAAIILSLDLTSLNTSKILLGTLMTASIAGLTIGGKALGKSFALREADEIIFQTGRLLAAVERLLPWKILNGMPKRGKQ